MPSDLQNPIFHDEDAARSHFEATRWPNSPYCPLCGSYDAVKPFGGKSMGPGWYHCNACRRKFTATMGTVMERSHIPLTKWLLAIHLLCSSKKGMSAHQLHRMLGVTYKSAWFMAMRIREAMRELRPESSGPLGGGAEGFSSCAVKGITARYRLRRTDASTSPPCARTRSAHPRLTSAKRGGY